MSIRNTKLGGTDFSTEGVDVVDLNDTNNALVPHRKVHTAPTERTSTSDTWADLTGGEFTITNALNALIIGIYIEADLEDAGTGQAHVNLKIDGTNLGTKFVISKQTFFVNEAGDNDSFSAIISDTEGELLSETAGYLKHTLTAFLPLKLLDATTTFTVRFRNGVNGQTAKVKNVRVEIVYFPAFADD